MSEAQEIEPPKIRKSDSGVADVGSVADLLEWFLIYDERTARMRHLDTEEVFQWKQQDDKMNGVNIYPFENAEARFAIGVFQALETNRSDEELSEWITSLLEALQEAHKTKIDLAEAYGLGEDLEASTLERSQILPSNLEKRLYLTSCWIEALCTAEVRFLGWMYQELHGRPFA